MCKEPLSTVFWHLTVHCLTQSGYIDQAYSELNQSKRCHWWRSTRLRNRSGPQLGVVAKITCIISRVFMFVFILLAHNLVFILVCFRCVYGCLAGWRYDWEECRFYPSVLNSCCIYLHIIFVLFRFFQIVSGWVDGGRSRALPLRVWQCLPPQREKLLMSFSLCIKPRDTVASWQRSLPSQRHQGPCTWTVWKTWSTRIALRESR